MTPMLDVAIEAAVDCAGQPLAPDQVYLRDPFQPGVWHAPRCPHRAPRATTKETP